MNINDLQSVYNQKMGAYNTLKNQYKSTVEKLYSYVKSVEYIEKARAILQIVAQDVQSSIKLHIEDIVNLAIDTVFPNSYTFVLDFVLKRNKTECEMFVMDQDGNKQDIVYGNGGGLVDIISFALRISLYSLKSGKKNNTIILDEPFRFLSKDLHNKAGEILQELSEKLHIQFIIVTHEDSIVDYADRVFTVKKINNNSEVEII